MKSITVNASKTYQVLIGEGLLSQAPGQMAKTFGSMCLQTSDSIHPHVSDKSAPSPTLCIVSDDVVWPLYGKTLESDLKKAGFQVCNFVFPHGESSKNPNTACKLLEFLAQKQLTRTDVLLALGGGVVGDLTGFASAVYLRGIAFVQIPTTLLAAVDSSVGGKTGVNLEAGKNLAGAFWQPSLVLFDVDTIQTLPKNLLLDGLAEALKAAIIADADLLTDINHTPDFTDPKTLGNIVTRAIEIKKAIVEEDERDQGVRQLLNLGHTAGHAIEKCSTFTLSHGHAVAIGMTIETKAAAAEGWCNVSTAQTIIKAIQSLGFSLECPYNVNELTAAALQDKKRLGDQITLAVPQHLGKAQLKTIPVSQLKDFLKKGLLQDEANGLSRDGAKGQRREEPT